MKSPVMVGRQVEVKSGSDLPKNTSRRGYVLITSGHKDRLGELLYDNGTGTGQMGLLNISSGCIIAVTSDLTGGELSFDRDSLYMYHERTRWNTDAGSRWEVVRPLVSDPWEFQSPIYVKPKKEQEQDRKPKKEQEQDRKDEFVPAPTDIEIEEVPFEIMRKRKKRKGRPTGGKN